MNKHCTSVSRGVFATTVISVLSLGASLAGAQALEEIVVTAQKRESGIQTTSVAITAFSGDTLRQNRIFNVSDLANTAASLSFTALSPLDQEINIRGITNTRLDSPAGEAAVGQFVDEIFIGRTGGMNADYYDIERIEVIRGPQGVLLGKSVVGGALSIITAKPEFENSGEIAISLGNYDSQQISGHATGALSDNWAGRLSFQTRSHDGYAKDLLHDRDLEDLETLQLRAQIMSQPDSDGWGTRLIVDYSKLSSNGINVVAISDGLTGGFRPRPWSQMRAFLGLTDPRVSIPEETQYAGDQAPLNQFLSRETAGLTLHFDRDFERFQFSSITGYREARTRSLYDQTGGGPDVFDDPEIFGVTFADFLAFDPTAATFFFSEPVREDADIRSFSQEFRLTSSADSSFEWIAGVYFKNDQIDKFDRFVGEGNSGALPTLSGESHWLNEGDNTHIGVFGQIGYRFSEKFKASVGARWTSDDKGGDIRGTAIATGDRFNPADTVPLTPLGEEYDTSYGETWTKVTPQATLEFTPNDDLFSYLTISTGFKGGYFQDTPVNAFAAEFPTRPEEVINYEIGIKSDFAGGRARLNAAAFFMDYTDLQVEQTNQDCLCNLTENAADAEIKGVEVEFTFLATDDFLLTASGSFLDTEYVEFLELAGVDSSGNSLQRTPDTQYNIGFDYTANAGRFGKALNFYVSYSWQDEFPWQPANENFEDDYGLLDARITFAPEGKNWSLSVWGKNITDELYRTNIIPFFGEEVSQFGAPRTQGVEFRYSFE
ncbi:MAG: TonB-dependent receptor [Gammaproteobacteria bacterium]|nr:TonB-dependent receptor [Gammaproteobacteria bacterium]